MNTDTVIIGQSRSVFVVGALEDLMQWMQRLTRPKQAVLLRTIEWLADQPLPILQQVQHIWKHERGTSPPIYVIRKDQARLYCCLQGQDIVILCWAVKKSDKADPQELRRAERLANEIQHGR